jgi:RNA polymerase sigma-70 factor (ECF subfamily)
MLSQLDEVLRRVVPAQRLAWMLRHVEGHTLDDVAAQCGVSLATVKRHIARAEECLRGHLDFEPTPQGEP